MDKKFDFDYDAFMAFMKSLEESPHVSFVFRDNSSFYQKYAPLPTDLIIEMMDELEVEVASRPCYNTVEELMNAVKEM